MDWKYIVYISVLALLFAIVFLGKDKQYDWTVTLAHQDRNPYGTYALNELLPSVFINQKTEHCYKTFYELKDSLKQNQNVFLPATHFNPDKSDTRAMFQFVNGGGVIFISANYINDPIADTLSLTTNDYFFDGISAALDRNDTTTLQLVNPELDTTQLFFYKHANVHTYFLHADTSQKKTALAEATVIAKNKGGQPVALKINHGKGYFIFNCTPIIFTNIYLLNQQNHVLASSLLSYLPQKMIYWSEFYQLGRMEAATPLRFILSTEPLRWAYYISVVSILIFIIFETKRRQRIIPIVMPLRNTTLGFVSTIGNLYYERSDHKGIALKKILFFFESLRSRHNFSEPLHSPHYVQSLSLKTGVNQRIAQNLVDIIIRISGKESIDKRELEELNKSIQEFWSK